METQIKLPNTNKYGYYEIRLESIGGLGANLCGKMLGELGAIYLNMNASSFSSYGSEKRGSPVKAYIRYTELNKEIRLSSPIIHPNLLGIFHDAILEDESVIEGLEEFTTVVVNSKKTPEEIRDKIKLSKGIIYCIDALTIAMEEKTRMNVVMFGALTKATTFIALNDAKEIVKRTVGKKYPNLINENLLGLERGYLEIQYKKFEDKKEFLKLKKKEKIDLGYLNAPIGGINPMVGSTIINDVSASREGYIPLFDKGKCIHCGLCDITCPDMVFQFQSQWEKGKKKMMNMGLDYKHCKGCLRCVEICPTKALVAGVEREQSSLRYAVDNIDLLTRLTQYEKTGMNAYVTSEAYLSEKRIDGGVL